MYVYVYVCVCVCVLPRAETGFNHVGEENYEPRLLHFKGKRVRKKFGLVSYNFIFLVATSSICMLLPLLDSC